jgi:phosphatidylserine/phosphatidylglycerophosphate/cardiolipin synthase-like enzyme
MKELSKVIAQIALEVHPDRIEAVCSALGTSKGGNILPIVKGSLGDAFSSRLTKELSDALKANPKISSDEMSAMFRAASATASLAAGASSVEMVWTGPDTGMVPIRHTAQVLTGLIEEARERLFLVSFVAFHVGSVVDALQHAIERSVRVQVLLEQSKEHGGNVSVDSAAILRRNLPRALLYEWDKKMMDASLTASVHAKCAVADGTVAFVTSANLSDAAMERNMEIGVLLRGGHVPRLLDQHLAALITTKQLREL